jgi:hypothetical protein
MSLIRFFAAFIAIGLGIFSLGCVRSAESSVGNSEMAGSSVEMENNDGRKFLKNLHSDFELPTDDAGELLLREYGSVFVARNGAVPPKKIFFESEAEVRAFQESVETESEKIGRFSIELQKPAMRALEDAVKQARKARLSITPRGADSGRRGYNQTISLWKSRVEPGLSHWTRKGRLSAAEVSRIRRMGIREQITEILRLEQDSIFFAKSLDKSIIYSVAPPGSSQHIAMLALDVSEFNDVRVRAILAENGWFQTVVSDLPHFTYLGVSEEDLPSLGLKKVSNASRDFWIPDLPPIERKRSLKTDRPKVN